MPQQGTPYLIPFGSAGMVSHPNRWRAKAGELLLGENVVLENDLINKEPAATYYDLNGVSFGFLTYSWSATTSAFITLVQWYDADPTGTIVGHTISAGATAPPLTWTQAITANAPTVGSVHAVRLSATTGALATAVTDSAGNVYTKVQDYTQTSGSLHGQIWLGIITKALSVSDQLTVTLAAGTQNVNLIATTITGLRIPLKLRAQLGLTATSAVSQAASSGLQDFPVIGIGLIAGLTTTNTLIFTSSAPFTVNTQINTGGHTQGAITAPPFWAFTKIICQIEWRSDETSTITSSASVNPGSKIVTGTGTTFTTTFRPGDGIILDGEAQVVDQVISNTTLWTIAPWQNSHTVTSFFRWAGPVLITALNREDHTQSDLVKEIPRNGARGNHGQIQGTIFNFHLSKTRRGRFVVGGKEDAARPRKLFYLNGVDPIMVIAGDATTNNPIAKPSADWGVSSDATKQPINGIVHQDSFVVFGNLNDPHRIYWSTPSDHEDFQTTAAPTVPYMSIRVASNIGRRLYGAAQFQGVLYLWKHPYGIFYVDDTPIDRLQWSYRIRSMALGCAPSPYAVLATDDDVIFCDAEGHFHLLSAVATLGGTRDSDLTRALGLHTWTQQNVDITSLNTLVSVYNTATKTAWFGLRSMSAAPNDPGDNDLVIRWDFSLVAQGGPVRMTTARMWVPNSLCVKHHDFTGREAVCIGEYGNCWFVEPQTYGRRTNLDYAAGGTAVDIGVPTRITLPELDYGDSQGTNRAIRKSFRSLEMIAQATENKNHPVSMTINIDGVFRQTLRYPQGPNRRRLQPLQCGDGYSLSADIVTDGSVVGDVPLIGLIIYYAPTGTDMSRKS
jgi:hypothetical protein